MLPYIFLNIRNSFTSSYRYVRKLREAVVKLHQGSLVGRCWSRVPSITWGDEGELGKG